MLSVAGEREIISGQRKRSLGMNYLRFLSNFRDIRVRGRCPGGAECKCARTRHCDEINRCQKHARRLIVPCAMKASMKKNSTYCFLPEKNQFEGRRRRVIFCPPPSAAPAKIRQRLTLYPHLTEPNNKREGDRVTPRSVEG